MESGTSGLRFRLAPAIPAALALWLAGCSSFPSSMNPVSWWHDLQGGKIAEERPPPPGADQPYGRMRSALRLRARAAAAAVAGSRVPDGASYLCGSSFHKRRYAPNAAAAAPTPMPA